MEQCDLVCLHVNHLVNFGRTRSRAAGSSLAWDGFIQGCAHFLFGLMLLVLLIQNKLKNVRLFIELAAERRVRLLRKLSHPPDVSCQQKFKLSQTSKQMKK